MRKSPPPASGFVPLGTTLSAPFLFTVVRWSMPVRTRPRVVFFGVSTRSLI